MKHLKSFNEEYMYTFDIFCFGYELSNNPELNNLVCGFDIEFGTKINGRRWEISTPYHGGQVNGDIQTVVFGTQITDSDGNREYTREIRSAKESDYISDCREFIGQFIKDLDDNLDVGEDGYSELVDKLKEFIENNEPCFYSVEASS